MPNCRYINFFCMLGMVLVFACPALGAAVLWVSDDSFDFGPSLADVELKHVFVVKTVGDTALDLKDIVTSVPPVLIVWAETLRPDSSGSAVGRPCPKIQCCRYTSCGCTVAQLVKKSLGPGEATELQVTLSTKGLNGKVSRQILIESNAPGSRKKVLNLLAEVAASPVVVEPPVISVPPADPGRGRIGNATLRVTQPSTTEVLGETPRPLRRPAHIRKNQISYQ